MLLHDKMQLLGAPDRLLASGFAGLAKIALAAICLQAHARLRSCCVFFACGCDLVARVAPRRPAAACPALVRRSRVAPLRKLFCNSDIRSITSALARFGASSSGSATSSVLPAFTFFSIRAK